MPLNLKSFLLKISAALVLLSAAYLLWGHALIAFIYGSQSLPLLGRLFEAKNQFPLEVYLRTGDAYWIAILLIGVLFLIPFRILLDPGISESRRWAAAGALMFAAVVLFYFKPYFAENETVYLISPRRLLNPDYLTKDWTWNRGLYTHLFFDLLLSPFTLALNDYAIALIGRLTVWGFLIQAFIRLAQTLRLKWWQTVLGFIFWLCTAQSLAAGEWVFHSFEAKPVAYYFLLRGLDHMLNDRWIKTALSCGLAFSFHILVGAWGSFAILIAALITLPFNKLFEKLGKTAAVFTLAAAPGILTAVLYKLKSGSVSYEDYALEIFFRSPHHFDPSYFMPRLTALTLLFYLPAAFWLIHRTQPRETAKKLSSFLGALIAVFLLGLVAYKLSWLSVLYLYPFRLGPVFLSLFFSFLAFKALKTQGILVGVFLVLLGFQFEVPRNILRWPAGLVFEWRNFLSEGRTDDFEDMASWIRFNTPPDSIFIAPPWEYRFSILSHRAQVVNFKYYYVDHTIHEWLERLKALNGGLPFKKRSAGILSELKANYPSLTSPELEDTGKKYSASYYLTTAPRPDLPFALQYSNASYYLYLL